MSEGRRAKAQKALLLAALVLMMSCSAAASPSNCIPRRLLVVSRSYYQRAPCNDDQIDRPTPSGTNDGMEKSAGSRIPGRGPPAPMGGRPTAQSAPAIKAPPGSNN